MAPPDALMTAHQLRALTREVEAGLVVRHVVIHPYSGVITATDDWTGRSGDVTVLIAPSGALTYDDRDPEVFRAHRRRLSEEEQRRLEEESSP